MISSVSTPETAVHAAPAAAIAPAAPRFDMYSAIHKALRSMMGQTLVLVGRVDVADDEELLETLEQVGALLDLCAAHLEHENAFIHPAIEARQPGGAQRTAEDHVEHAASIDALRQEARALPTAAAHVRPALAQRLYRHLALFIAENLQHMHVEESVNNASLWAHHGDDDLIALHRRLLASIPPVQSLAVARWMVPALNPRERAAMLNGAKGTMPPEAFIGVLEHVRPHVDAHGWARLVRDVGIGDYHRSTAAA